MPRNGAATVVMMTFLIFVRVSLAMFDFLFKRNARKPAVAAPPLPSPAAITNTAAREASRERASALQLNEAESLAFLLSCEFADARLIAAQAIVTQPALLQALIATRNSDRRVARLMQARLDVLRSQGKLREAAAACIADATALLSAQRLTPNQVAELDRRWKELLPVPDDVQQQFDSPRAALSTRLVAQAALQRALIDLLASLRTLRNQALDISTEHIDTQVAQSEEALVRHRSDPESMNLPKQLLTQCEQALHDVRQLRESVDRQHAALSARMEQLALWEAEPVASFNVARLQHIWSNLPPLSVPSSSVQERFEQLLAEVSVHQAAVDQSKRPRVPVLHALPVDAIDSMEQALEQGLLQPAAEIDRQLRALDPIAANDPQSARLGRLRAELARLQGWARWGGNISREELQKAAESLPQQALSVAELAKKIGTLRERWKSLDASAGPAPRELWHGFDHACTHAYAPVAAHFQEMKAERQRNVTLAFGLITEIHQYADQIAVAATPDWKALTAFCQRSLQGWQRLGTTDRRTKRQLDDDFNSAMERLRSPLSHARALEIAEREQLIADVARLSPTDRTALDTLRSLQERWQDRARSLPLERSDEQALWVRFRTACDAVFAKRKEAAAGADAERQENRRRKEALCDLLETAGATQSVDAAAVLSQTAADWNAIGAVPRAAEDALTLRYRRASAAVLRNVELDRASADAERRQMIGRRLTLCVKAEALVSTHSVVSETEATKLEAEWKSCGPCTVPIEHALARRFERAADARRLDDEEYRRVFLSNGPMLQKELLRLEISLSIDSPAELARERLHLQVEGLQSALKSGRQSLTDQQTLIALCEMPARLDEHAVERLLRIIERMS